jgi:hypothetical protein
LVQTQIANSGREGQYLHVCPNIKITARDLIRADEDMPTVTTSTIDPYGVLSTMRLRAIQADLAALVAVRSISRPSSLIPTALEALSNLGRSKRKQSRKGKESALSEHRDWREEIRNTTEEVQTSVRKGSR